MMGRGNGFLWPWWRQGFVYVRSRRCEEGCCEAMVSICKENISYNVSVQRKEADHLALKPVWSTKVSVTKT